MNTKAAAKLIVEHNMQVLRWNGTFTKATVRTPSGDVIQISTAGGRAKVVERLNALKL